MLLFPFIHWRKRNALIDEALNLWLTGERTNSPRLNAIQVELAKIGTELICTATEFEAVKFPLAKLRIEE